MERDAVTEEEQQGCSEFFIGRARKTPERYLMIRNHMVQKWEHTKPLYLTKLQARKGLKGCGDVNAIGRVHAFLEQAGIINQGATKTYVRRGRPPAAKRPLSSDDDEEAIPSKRRTRSTHDGHVIRHDVVERRGFGHSSDSYCSSGGEDEENKRKPNGGEFQLVPCKAFSQQQPFGVEVTAAALVLMDLHSHLLHTEIIGLLGGTYQDGAIRADLAFPCRSTHSTSTECELDPVSELEARQLFAQQGRQVVGWFHSHPEFEPLPSVRDIANQRAYQTLCRRKADNVEPFVGLIVSPPSTRDQQISQIEAFYVIDNQPYSLEYRKIEEEVVPEELISEMVRLVETYRWSNGRRNLGKQVRRNGGKSAMQSLLDCLRAHWKEDVREGWDQGISVRLRPLFEEFWKR